MIKKVFERAIEEGTYIAETGATVRKTASIFGVGKSTVHKDVTERLFLIDKDLFYEVDKILKINLAERHIRGGNATRQKYLDKKNLSKL